MGRLSADGIRIFLRLRPPATLAQSSMMGELTPANEPFMYDVEDEIEGSTLKIVDQRSDGENVSYNFSFRRVLSPNVSQETVFNSVAKDCVLAALDGMNSTVFAYGQTGSGKTFSINGGAESWEDRGIIPRSLAMIYEEISKRSTARWTVSVSFLQIYNEKGQDLLNHGKDSSTMEELPNVTVHDLGDVIELRNLDQHAAPTLSDALKLVFLGETNRMYCETPMNKSSSRSHCVFSVTLKSVSGTKSRTSKLNLVDLAGSERVAKSAVNGTVLTEAKYINSSLHYLELVIRTLGEQTKGKQDYVPFRNCFLTMVLRDSLGANCRTAMLATVHTAKWMTAESISTCRFAQRVALVRQNAQVNEETDPVLMVKKLKAEILQLKDRLKFAEQGGGSADRDLTGDEQYMCETMVNNYLFNEDPSGRMEGFDGDLARIYYCFSLMKKMVSQGGPSSHGGGSTLVEEQAKQLEDCKAQVETLQISLQQKENEMTMLFDMLHKTHAPKSNAQTQTPDGGTETAKDALESARRVAVAMRLDAHAPHSTLLSTPSGTAVAPPVMPFPAATLPYPTPQPEVTSSSSTTSAHTAAAMAKVNVLGERGKLSEAQVTAVTEFLKSSEEHQKSGISTLTDADLLQNRAAALELFKQSYKGYAKVEEMKSQLKTKIEACKAAGRDGNIINDRIKAIKKQIMNLRAERALSGIEEVSDVEQSLLEKLKEERLSLNTYVDEVRQQKEEIECIEAFLQRSKDQLAKSFEEWISVRQRQVQLAMRAMQTDPNQQITTTSNTSSVEFLPAAKDPMIASSPAEVIGATPPLPIASTTSPLNMMSSPEWHPSSAPSSTTVASRSIPSQQFASSVQDLHSQRILVRPSPSSPPSAAGGWVGGPTELATGRSRANPHHLQPLPNSSLPSSVGSPVSTWYPMANAPVPPAGTNPYAPAHRTTGDSAADEVLAALYRQREAMRQNFSG